MAIDGIFLFHLKKELELALENTRIDKIHQPDKSELVLLLRGDKGNKRLLISARPSVARINFISDSPENPETPPMFCMLLRKHLSGARFKGFEDNGFERIATFVFEALNELGDRVTVKLCLELVGKQTNIILINGDGRIIDCIKRSDLEAAGRILAPGAKYTLPERKDKLNIFETDDTQVVSAVSGVKLPVKDALIECFDGISPLIAREIAQRAGVDTDKLANCLTDGEKKSLTLAVAQMKGGNVTPTALIDDRGVPFEFSYTDITQYKASAECKRYDSLSSLLDAVYRDRDNLERIRALASDLHRFVSNLQTRIAKKIAVRQKEKEKCKSAESLRICGELLKANLYAIERGMPYADVQNYYDPEFKTVRIPLDVKLSPANNAQKYFKEYKKCCNAATMLDGLIAEAKAELEYIESVADELKRASTVLELREIRAELSATGYLRLTVAEKRSRFKPSEPIRLVSPDGYEVLVGRNNNQNDRLTLRIADDGDMWFHTKNIPGSHIIVRCGGDELPESTVMFAAKLAALHSKAAQSSSVPIDYTRVKYIKKPQGARPGMVIYKTNKTVYVTPERNDEQ